MTEEQTHVAIATPCHTGDQRCEYGFSVYESSRAMQRAGWRVSQLMLRGDSHIDRARCLQLHDFLLSSATHLWTFDGDQSLHPFDAIVELVKLDLDVVGIPVPLKRHYWGDIAAAARRGVPDEELHRYGKRFAYQLDEDGVFAVDRRGVAEVRAVGTGCLLIKRSVIEKMMVHYSDEWFRANGDNHYGEPIPYLISSFVRASDREFVSEDYAFCGRWREMGGKVHMYCQASVTHYGSAEYQGDVFRSLGEAAPEWSDIPSLPDTNPQKKWHLYRYEWAAAQLAKNVRARSTPHSLVNAACGSGYGNAILAPRCADVLGVDRDHVALDIAKAQKYPGTFWQADIQNKKFDGRTALVSLETLEHLVDPHAWLRGLAPSIAEIVVSAPVIPTKHENQWHLHDFTQEDIRKMVCAAGFAIVSEELQDEWQPDAVLLIHAVRRTL